MSESSPILINSDGLFNGVRWSILMSQTCLDQMEKYLGSLQEKDTAEGKKPKPSDAKLRADQREVIELLNELPKQRYDSIEFGWRNSIHGGVSRANTSGEMMIMVPNLMGNFLTSLISSLSSKSHWDEDPEAWGLEAVRKLTGHQKTLKALAQKTWEDWGEENHPQSDVYHKCSEHGELVPTNKPGVYAYKGQLRHEVSIASPQMINEKALKAAKRLADMISSGEVSVRSNNALDNLRQATAFAVYSDGYDGAGYLDGRANFVDGVGGARLFESAKSAETTIRSRQLRNAAVVALDVQVTGMAPGHSASQFEKLGQVISDLNRRKLMELVSSVRGEDIAELKEKLSAREDELAEKSGEREARQDFRM